MKIKDTFGDRAFTFFCYAVVILVAFICLYPLWLVLVYSVSDPDAVNAGKVWLWPVGVTWDAYKEVFSRDDLMKGYLNTITQTLFGTAVNMAMTIPAAYALSKTKLKGRGFFMGLIVFTMYFSGGLIPNFINLKNLRLLNTWWVFGLCGAVSSYNLIVARTFFVSGIPQELEEAAEIDGCNPIQIFLKIVLPLSKAMISVIMLYYAVFRWNDYTSALYFQPMAQKLYPLQMILRQILVEAVRNTMIESSELADYYANIANQMKYAVIGVASVPLLILYPFVQKYFEKGVMLGSVKG